MTTSENPVSVEPAVTMFETETEVLVLVDLPGVSKDNLNLTIEQGRLHLEAALQPEHSSPDKTGQEVFWSRFERSISVGPSANPDEVTAKLDNGILRICFQKKPEACPRKIQISDGEET